MIFRRIGKIYLIMFTFYLLTFLYIQYGYALEYIDLSPWDYQKLTDVDAKIMLADNETYGGDVLVTQTITFDVHQSSKKDLCHELWLDLPEQTVDGLRLDYDVFSVTQIMDDGSAIVYDECSSSTWLNNDVEDLTHYWYHSSGPYSKLSDRYECVFFYTDGIYRDTVTFEVTYKMNNVALKYGDCSDLYLMLYSESPIKDLKSYKADIIIPTEDMPSTNNYDIYTYGTNDNGFDYEYSLDKYPGCSTFSIDLDESELKFKPHNLYLEFELVSFGEDAHIFTEHAGRNQYSYYDALEEIQYEYYEYNGAPLDFKVRKVVTFLILVGISVYILIWTLTNKNRIQKNHMIYGMDDKSAIEPYGAIPSDLDPNFAAALVFCKDEKSMDYAGVYSAILLSLARKDYVSIEPQGSLDALLTVKNPQLLQESSIMPCEPLTESELLYYNLLVRHANGYPILMSVFRNKIEKDYENTAAFDDNIKKAVINTGINAGYIQKADFMSIKESQLKKARSLSRVAFIFIVIVNTISLHTRMDLAYGAYLILGITSLVCSVIIKNQAKRAVLLTSFGEAEYRKWKGLYNYIKDNSFAQAATLTGMPIWERYFIYATAFGIPDKVTKALGIACPEFITAPDNINSVVFSNHYLRTGSRHRYGKRFNNSISRSRSLRRQSIYTRSYTGGGRSFGSYGGGGS